MEDFETYKERQNAMFTEYFGEGVEIDVVGLHSARKMAAFTLEEYNSLNISSLADNLIQRSNKFLNTLKQTCGNEGIDYYEKINNENNNSLNEILKNLKIENDYSTNEEHKVRLNNIISTMDNMRHQLCVLDTSTESEFDYLDKRDNYEDCFEDWYVAQNIEGIYDDIDKNYIIELRNKPREKWTEDEKTQYKQIIIEYIIDTEYLKALFNKPREKWTKDDYEKYNQVNHEDIIILEQFYSLQKKPQDQWTDEDFASFNSCISYNPELLLASLKSTYDTIMTYHDDTKDFNDDDQNVINAYLNYLNIYSEYTGVDLISVCLSNPRTNHLKNFGDLYLRYGGDWAYDADGIWIERDESERATVVEILGYDPGVITKEMIDKIIRVFDENYDNYFFNNQRAVSEFIEFGNFYDRGVEELTTRFFQTLGTFTLSLIEGSFRILENLVDGFVMLTAAYVTVQLAPSLAIIYGINSDKLFVVPVWVEDFVKEDLCENAYESIVSAIGIPEDVAFGSAHDAGLFVGETIPMLALQFIPGSPVFATTIIVSAYALKGMGSGSEEALQSGNTFWNSLGYGISRAVIDGGSAWVLYGKTPSGAKVADKIGEAVTKVCGKAINTIPYSNKIGSGISSIYEKMLNIRWFGRKFENFSKATCSYLGKVCKPSLVTKMGVAYGKEYAKAYAKCIIGEEFNAEQAKIDAMWSTGVTLFNEGIIVPFVDSLMGETATKDIVKSLNESSSSVNYSSTGNDSNLINELTLYERFANNAVYSKFAKKMSSEHLDHVKEELF